MWGGTCLSLCSQGILGICEGRCQVDNPKVWLLLLSFEDLGQGKLTGSGVQSIGPRSMRWENFQIYGQREAVLQGVSELTISGGGGRGRGRNEGHHHSRSLYVKYSSEHFLRIGEMLLAAFRKGLSLHITEEGPEL